MLLFHQDLFDLHYVYEVIVLLRVILLCKTGNQEALRIHLLAVQLAAKQYHTRFLKEGHTVLMRQSQAALRNLILVTAGYAAQIRQRLMRLLALSVEASTNSLV